MAQKRDAKRSLEAFIRAHSYPAEHGLIVRRLLTHRVHARSDRGNAAAYFRFPGLKALEAHISELPAGAAARLHRHSCEALFYVLKGPGLHRASSAGWSPKDCLESGRLVFHAHRNVASAR